MVSSEHDVTHKINISGRLHGKKHPVLRTVAKVPLKIEEIKQPELV